MSTAFKHPLARDAKIWPTGGLSDLSKRILVVITTLELDRDHKRFKADKVQRLADAAGEWVQQNGTAADDFMLISRPRDWEGAKA